MFGKDAKKNNSSKTWIICMDRSRFQREHQISPGDFTVIHLVENRPKNLCTTQYQSNSGLVQCSRPFPIQKKVNLDPPFSICVNSDFFFEFASYILLYRNVDFLEMLNFVLLLVAIFCDNCAQS